MLALLFLPDIERRRAPGFDRDREIIVDQRRRLHFDRSIDGLRSEPAQHRPHAQRRAIMLRARPVRTTERAVRIYARLGHTPLPTPPFPPPTPPQRLHEITDQPPHP